MRKRSDRRGCRTAHVIKYLLDYKHSVLYGGVFCAWVVSELLRHGWHNCEAYAILYMDVYIACASELLRHGWRNCEAYAIMTS